MIEKWDAFPLLYLKDVLILLRQFHIVIVYAPVAQGIEHRPPVQCCGRSIILRRMPAAAS